MPALKSIVFLGSKPVGYRCLHYLLQHAAEWGVQLAAVMTQARKEFAAESDVAELAGSAGIPILTDEHEIPDCDLIYSVQYHKILKPQIISKAALAVNLHMAPLPEYRGSNQFSYAILDGKSEFGVTIHEIDARIDHGDILFQKRFSIPAECWVEDLYERTETASVDLFRETIYDLLNGNFTRTPQKDLEAVCGTSLHFKAEIQDLKRLHLTWEADKIARHIRATLMPGFEPPHAMVAGRKIYFSAERPA